MSPLVRAASMSALCCLVALHSGLAHAKTARQVKMARQLDRYTKYFKNAHKVVVNGGIAPYVHMATLGWQGKLGVGLRAGIGRATLVRKGMERSTLCASGGGSLGIQLGFGPESKDTYFFGRPGHKANEIVPAAHAKHGANLFLFGMEQSYSEQKIGSKSITPAIGIKFVGVEVPLLLPFGKAQKRSQLLQRIEEGQGLTRQARVQLSSGNSIQARNTLDRLKILRQRNVEERKMVKEFTNLY